MEKGKWQNGLGDYDVIINLAGASIFKKWTKKNKNIIRESRIITTNNIVDGLKNDVRGTTLLSASAVGYYGFHGDEALQEESPAGTDFLAVLSNEWEKAAQEAEDAGARVVTCRFGIVLGKEGGALRNLIPLYKYWMGSPLGKGDQWFSWIHLQDLVNILLFLIRNTDISGPVNCTAPEPVRNREMTRIIGEVMNKPVFMPSVPGFMIRLILGEFGNTLLNGQRVLPEKLEKAGFLFRFRDFSMALRDILSLSIK